MSTRLALAASLVLAACGDDGASVTPDAPPAIDMAPDAPALTCPSATATGTVGGNTLDPITGVIVLESSYREIIITEGDGTCSGPPSTGQYLSLQLCPGASALGDHPIVASVTCPSTNAAALFVDGGTLLAATGGTVTITSDAGGCTTGTYTATYAGGASLAGAFAAQACPVP